MNQEQEVADDHDDDYTVGRGRHALARVRLMRTMRERTLPMNEEYWASGIRCLRDTRRHAERLRDRQG